MSETPLTGGKKANLKLKQDKVKLLESQYQRKEEAFNQQVVELNDLKTKNAQKAIQLETKDQAIEERGAASRLGHGAIDLVVRPFKGGTERELLTQEIETLAASQAAAIQQENALVEDYSTLRQQKAKVAEEQQRVNRYEKNALKQEGQKERQVQKTLEKKKADTQAKGESTEDLDQQLADSKQRENNIQQARKDNRAATADNRAQSKHPAKSPVQGCPEVCEAHDLVVQCQHKGRKAALAEGAKVPELHVMSASYEGNRSGADVIQAYLAGSCGKGKTDISPVNGLASLLERDGCGQHCPYITVDGGNPALTIVQPGTSGSPLKFEAYSPPIDWGDGFFDKPSWYVFFKHLFFTDEEQKYTRYTLSGAHCDGKGANAVAEIYAHTHEKWVMEGAFGWETAKIEEKDINKSLKKKKGKEISPKTLTKTNWNIEGKVVGSLDTRNIQLEATPDFFNSVRGGLSHLLYFFDIIDGQEKDKDGGKDGGKSGGKKASSKKPKKLFTWKWIPPKVAIAAERERKENSSNNLIDLEYKYAIKADPFIGIEAKVDVLQALILLAVNCAAPGAGAGAIKFVSFVREVLVMATDTIDTATDGVGFLQQAKDKIADTTSVDFKAEITFTMEFVLAGELSCTKAFAGEPKAELAPIENTSSSDSANVCEEDQADNSSSTSVGAELAGVAKLDLTGEVKAELRHTNSWFEVQAAMGAGFKVGAKGGGATELALKLIAQPDPSEPFKGEFEFKGMVLFFMSYATASIEKAETDIRGVDGATSSGDDINDDYEFIDESSQPEKGEELKEQIKATEGKEVWTIFDPITKPIKFGKDEQETNQN